ncbi:hypothetical protein NIES4075_61900 [Tolypothrix sp. NIES-4075]|uniref:hypothetical protein n=1 Tax=Tolypothrix sp. NIES-4075 TaxID=2005459 RepID=UPI000B5D0532|nr:hypothetical protein [Tolypothrix sp. NIES-4075]GAX45169.1 hypothetical protein NIES4075_61900 [Tolypothrix sp. NIES-4075]
MITESDLVQQFTIVVNHYEAQLGERLRHCYIKVIQSSWKKHCVSLQRGEAHRSLPYIGIYCPDSMIAVLKEQKDVLKDVAQHLGLAEVVCINASRLLRDPQSKLKDAHPRLWLELHWMLTQEQEDLL